MWNLARAAWSLGRARRLPLSDPLHPRFHERVLSLVKHRGLSTLGTLPNEGVISPELLGKQVLRPDRVIGHYEDLVTRVTNFHNEDKGFMILAGDVFDVPIRKDIVHKVVRWQLAKRQQGTHSTKTISEVSGTGRKPYNQKGTGRARHVSRWCHHAWT
ncbi:hypothetical protein J5N97_003406 [Dioscorea zingiberensis]|uniref:Large ribosomal subunit protein uL4m n=1 Tax=Dioscorea zingiberensis TaxID=325984 RepID=A0A9D5HQ21_9LILI|nr:hypothetical protein J5N97_003406 [Dioscorea zingiberensis]